MQAPAGGPAGVRTQGRKGDDGSHKVCPPPLQRDRCRASCLRRACVVPATCVQRREDDKPPPTHTPPPAQGWGMKEGRGGQTPPPPRTKWPGGEAAERGCGTGHTTVPEGSTRRASPSRGAPWVRTQGRKGDDGSRMASPPPCRGTSAAPRACAVLATCLRQRTDSEGAPPLGPLLPYPPRKVARTVGRWRGDMGGGGQRTDGRARGRDGRRTVKTQEKKTKNKANQHARGRKREDRDQDRDERREAGASWACKGRWCRTRPRGYGGSKGETPPPHCSLALCLRRACVVPATCVLQREDDKGDKGDDGSGTRTPPPRTTRQGGEAAERGCGTDHTTVPTGSTRRASPSMGTTGGATAA